MAEDAKNQAGTQPAQPEPQAAKTYTAAEVDALNAQIASLTAQLTEANKTIKSYTDMDIEGIKQSAADWEQKAKTAEAERAAFEYRTKLNAYVKSLHLRDEIYEAHVAKLLEEKKLQFEGDKLIGGEDVVQTFRAAHADAFAPDPAERAAAPTSGKAPAAMSGVEKAFYSRNPGLLPAN